MSTISGYGIFRSSYYENYAKEKKEKMEKAERADKKGKSDGTKGAGAAQKAAQTGGTATVELSEKAKELLKELQKRYGDMDFFVGNYSSDEEAQSYLSRGTKAYSVLIEPETLEAMAADEDVKNQYLQEIDSARTNLDDIKDQLEESGQQVNRIGITIDSEGKVSYFADLEKMSENYREHLDKVREKEKEEKTEKEKKAEKEKKMAKENPYEDAAHKMSRKTTVKADSAEELLEKIKNVDWDSIREEEILPHGEHFNFSI